MDSLAKCREYQVICRGSVQDSSCMIWCCRAHISVTRRPGGKQLLAPGLTGFLGRPRRWGIRVQGLYITMKKRVSSTVISFDSSVSLALSGFNIIQIGWAVCRNSWERTAVLCHLVIYKQTACVHFPDQVINRALSSSFWYRGICIFRSPALLKKRSMLVQGKYMIVGGRDPGVIHTVP